MGTWVEPLKKYENKVQDSHRHIVKDSYLLVCEPVLGEGIPLFQRKVVTLKCQEPLARQHSFTFPGLNLHVILPGKRCFQSYLNTERPTLKIMTFVHHARRCTNTHTHTRRPPSGIVTRTFSF